LIKFFSGKKVFRWRAWASGFRGWRRLHDVWQ